MNRVIFLKKILSYVPYLNKIIRKIYSNYKYSSYFIPLDKHFSYKEVLKSKRSKNEYVVIDSFGGVQIPQEILSKSKIDSKASLTSDKTKISLNKILKRKK